MRIFLIIAFCYSNLTFETKAKTIKLSPTERYSLFDQDRSLSQFKIQDQDGGGTCYANSTSAVLQSIFPQQEISYQHIAITASIDDPVSKNRSQQYVTLNEAKVAEDFTSGGLMCDAINKLKKYGGACPKKFSRLENGSSSDPLVQSRAMLGLGKYFDKVNSIKSNPEKFKQFKLEAAEIVNATKKLYGNAINECREKKKKGELSMLSALQNGLAFKAIEAQLETLQDPKKSKCSDAIIEEIKKLSLKSSVFNSDQVTLYPTKATSDKFENIISSKTDPAFFNELTSFVNGNFSSDDKRKLAIKFGKKINDVMSELVSNDKFKDICDLRKDESGNTISPITGSVGVIGNSFLNLIKSERNTPCAKFNLESFDVLLNDQKRSCTNVLPINQILTALAPLIELGQALDETLINGLTDPNSKEATQIKKLLMPECLEKKNLIPLDGLKCSTKNMCDALHWASS